MQQILPVILAGGGGTRLWPLSRGHYPKQFLAVEGDPKLPGLLADQETMFFVAYDHGRQKICGQFALRGQPLEGALQQGDAPFHGQELFRVMATG